MGIKMSSLFKFALGGFVAVGAAVYLNSNSNTVDDRAFEDSAEAEEREMDAEFEEDNEDENIWLEDVTGEKSIEWVKDQNSRLAHHWNPTEDELYDRILKILDSKDKIPYVTKRGEYYYNFWKDADHVRGIYRRTTLESYRKDEPDWETVFDLDAYNGSDQGGENKWVWKGTTLLDEGPDVEPRRVLMKLSKGGADAVVIREFDLLTKQFVDENAFYIPEAKSNVCFKDKDTLLVGTEFDNENSLTDSGYPRIVKEWKRGTPLSEAKTVFEGEKTDVSVGGYYYRDHDHFYEMYYRSLTFYTSEHYFKVDGEIVKLNLPEHVQVSTFADQLLIELRKDWGSYSAGSLLSIQFDKFISEHNNIDVIDDLKSDITHLFKPLPERSLQSRTETKNCMVLTVLNNVVSQLVVWVYDSEGHQWNLRGELEAGGNDIMDVSASGIDADESDLLWVYSDSYNMPSTFSLVSALGDRPSEILKQLSHQYDATDVKVEQHEAISKDGTSIKYFMVYKGDLPKSTPTLLYGYGGFEVSLTPGYQAVTGVGWLEKGFVYVVANIRGGGEYGPSWHQAALKEKRHKAYEDFEAVGLDLIDKGITSKTKLACYGGSNGGLLVGNMLTRSPEMWGAIICAVPLLDMRRYNKLLAGASWMGEYGNPDIPEEWEFIQTFSPYHMLDKRRKYPPVLFTTSTRDDRVHPAHARKMVKRMHDMGFGRTTHYWENIEGGHGGSSTNDQKAYAETLKYMFLYTYLNK